ncbi:MAG: hypothetical protein ACI4I6_06630 [Hominimerdicola sp.]
MIKTVNLTAAVTAVEVTGKQNVTVRNVGNNTAYVSASPDISVGGDGVLSVKAGEIVTLEGVASLKKAGNQYGIHGTVYALASGATTIELIPTNSVNFKPAAVDYSGEISDISALIPAAASAGNQLTDKAYVDSELSGKVDKADGMGLSSNDYTTAEKDKLASLENYDDSTVNSAIADLQTSKANTADVYTKTETDTKITEKVAEIVADAPEDFDTLKEMSDWIANHEDDAAAMNSAIQTNTSNIASLQTDKVDKETGKSLVSDSEIERLATLENYTLPTASADTLGGVKIGEGLSITDGVLSASGGGLGNLKIAYGVVTGADTTDYVIDYSSVGFTQIPAVFGTVIKDGDSNHSSRGVISVKTSDTKSATLNRTFFSTVTSDAWGDLNDFCWLAIGV